MQPHSAAITIVAPLAMAVKNMIVRTIQALSVLKGQGYVMNQVDSFISDASGITDEAPGNVLKAAGPESKRD